jgi:hypothetical protein
MLNEVKLTVWCSNMVAAVVTTAELAKALHGKTAKVRDFTCKSVSQYFQLPRELSNALFAKYVDRAFTNRAVQRRDTFALLLAVKQHKHIWLSRDSFTNPYQMMR